MSNLKDVPDLVDYPYEWAWNQHPTNPMSIVVYHWGRPVMSFFLGEAMESAGYNHVMQHVEECNRTPWLVRWQQERGEHVMDALTKDYENLR